MEGRVCMGSADHNTLSLDQVGQCGDLVLAVFPPPGTQDMLVKMAAQGQRIQMGPDMVRCRGHILSLPSKLYICLLPASGRTDLMIHSEAWGHAE